MRYRNVKTGMIIATTGAVHGEDWEPVAPKPTTDPPPASEAAKPPQAEAAKPPAKRQGKKAAAK